jgi:hypothetical protein
VTPLRDNRLVDRYLERVDAAAVTGLGRARRLDLIDDIRSHISALFPHRASTRDPPHRSRWRSSCWP